MPFSESQKGIPYASPNTKVTHLTGVKHKCNTLNRGCCLNNLREAETVFKSHNNYTKITKIPAVLMQTEQVRYAHPRLQSSVRLVRMALALQSTQAP